VHTAGDAEVGFTIQSISKAFVYALVCEAYGHEVVRARSF
jgi:glutaminase